MSCCRSTGLSFLSIVRLTPPSAPSCSPHPMARGNSPSCEAADGLGKITTSSRRCCGWLKAKLARSVGHGLAAYTHSLANEAPSRTPCATHAASSAAVDEMRSCVPATAAVEMAGVPACAAQLDPTGRLGGRLGSRRASSRLSDCWPPSERMAAASIIRQTRGAFRRRCSVKSCSGWSPPPHRSSSVLSGTRASDGAPASVSHARSSLSR